jgi:RNA polymerase sigma-70 factor (ECF subfamily)
VADPAIALALDDLSIDHRAVVVCRLLLGWSEAQTADALAIRPGTVKSRLSRASTQLARRLHHLRDA